MGIAAPTPAPTGGQIIGNRNSMIYHRPDCPDYNKVSERNRVFFKTESEAAAAGYRKARNCPWGYVITATTTKKSVAPA